MVYYTTCNTLLSISRGNVWMWCDEWQTEEDTTKCLYGGASEGLSWLPFWPIQWLAGWEEDRKTDKHTKKWPDVEAEHKRKREKKGGKEKRGLTFFNFSLRRSKGHGSMGRWVSKWEKKGIIYLSSIFLTLIPLSLFPPFPSFHASVLLFLAPRGSAAKANKQRRLFISASGGKQCIINLVLPCLGLPQPTKSFRKTA